MDICHNCHIKSIISDDEHVRRGIEATANGLCFICSDISRHCDISSVEPLAMPIYKCPKCQRITLVKIVNTSKCCIKYQELFDLHVQFVERAFDLPTIEEDAMLETELYNEIFVVDTNYKGKCICRDVDLTIPRLKDMLMAFGYTDLVITKH